VEKCVTAGEGTDNNIIDACALHAGLIKATETHSEYVIRTAFSL